MGNARAHEPLIDYDSAADNEAIIALEREFPGWQVFRGINHVCYARKLLASPENLIRGEDWTDLRDELRRETGRS